MYIMETLWYVFALISHWSSIIKCNTCILRYFLNDAERADAVRTPPWSGIFPFFWLIPSLEPTDCNVCQQQDGLSACMRVKFPLDALGEKNVRLTHFTNGAKWVIYHAWVMQHHTRVRMLTHTQTRREKAEIITAMVTLMQKIKEQSTYCSMAAGRQAVTARRERDYWNTHAHNLCHTHTDTRKVRYVSQHTDVLFCNLSVYKIHLNRLLWDSERQRMLPFCAVSPGSLPC